MGGQAEQQRGPERLRVYLLAQDLAVSADGIARSLVRSPSLADQLRRASESVVLNIAEGAAHFTTGRKIYHYQTARGSAAECLAALNHVNRLRPSDAARSARNNANMVCMMLTGLIRSLEARR